MSSMYYIKMTSPIGQLYLTASEKGLTSIHFQKPNKIQKISPHSKNKIHQILNKAQKQLNEYFNGKRFQFNLPLDLQGTSFQLKVWKELKNIPFGQTCSYLDLAIKINNPRATRAVGGANGKNPLCIIIPCHRVINHNGKIGGYSGGLDIKKKLLHFENGSICH
jgi:methylated-DNA-[protein]-cysteine S-methyltransferase